MPGLFWQSMKRNGLFLKKEKLVCVPVCALELHFRHRVFKVKKQRLENLILEQILEMIVLIMMLLWWWLSFVQLLPFANFESHYCYIKLLNPFPPFLIYSFFLFLPIYPEN